MRKVYKVEWKDTEAYYSNKLKVHRAIKALEKPNEIENYNWFTKEMREKKQAKLGHAIVTEIIIS